MTNMDKQPLISVIMATFNEEPEFITESIQSILDQTYTNFEFIILDDSNDDDTKTAIDRLASSDSRIKVIRKKERMGFVPALNEGLRMAKGDFIARMDGDDISYPYRFEIQLKYLRQHPEVDILGGALDIIDEKGCISSCRFYPLQGLSLKFYTILRDPIAHPTVMMRKERLKKWQYDESYKRGEDIELWLRLRNKGAKIRNLKKPLLKYRVIPNMETKRDSFHFKYVYRARLSNFNWKYCGFDIPSLIAAYMYQRLPVSLVRFVYGKENKTESKKN